MAAAEHQPEYRSGDAMLVLDEGLRVLDWNAAAERLTGTPASQAVGRHCWQLLAGTQPDGTLICHPRCSHARLALSGWPVPCFDVAVRTGNDRRMMTLSTIVISENGRRQLIHLMRDATPAPDDGAATGGGDRQAPRLTPRQAEVFHLIAGGAPAKVIARRLGVSEATVRNHIRAILIELQCSSQLAAVARGRTLGII